MENAINVVLKFEQLINSRDAAAVCSLLTDNSVFVDSMGNRIEGAAKMRPAWEGYFKMVPDYTISHSEIFASGDTVALFGSAQGTFSKDGQTKKEDSWKTPAAWRGRADFVGLTAQGAVRTWSALGAEVGHVALDPSLLPRRCDAIVISDRERESCAASSLATYRWAPSVERAICSGSWPAWMTRVTR